jgi:hypothetical protein
MTNPKSGILDLAPKMIRPYSLVKSAAKLPLSQLYFIASGYLICPQVNFH